MSESIKINFSNLQGLIRKNYSLVKSCHLMLSFSDKVRAKDFLEEIITNITSADVDYDNITCSMNIGFTFEGLKALGIHKELLAEFPDDFSQGPIDRLNGDYGESASEFWWNKQFKTQDIHCIIHLFGANNEIIDKKINYLIKLFNEYLINLLKLSADSKGVYCHHLGDGRLHFGYRDGISQPHVAWSDNELQKSMIDFRHFILGYSTKLISSSPKTVKSRPASVLAEELVKDGTYSVIRWVYQDVASFNRFIEENAIKHYPNLDKNEAEELIAAKLVGRWRDGSPLVKAPIKPNSNYSSDNSFLYNQDDPEGMKCPFQAHIRIVNPRDQELNFLEGHTVPQLLRRGSPWGPELQGTIDDGQERGLFGMFLCSSISAQFYKIMSWMRKTDFSPVFDDHINLHDPFLSNSIQSRTHSSEFIIPNQSGNIALTLNSFIKTKGSIFLLMPSILSLKKIASGEFLSI